MTVKSRSSSDAILGRPRRWWMRTLIINAAMTLIVFGAIQLVPVSRENPPVLREPLWDSPETRALAQTACFDCHSNETVWPWYARLAPSSWVVWYDVTEGREALNFSEWDRHADDEYVDPNDPFPPKTLSERIEAVIRDGSMPPGTYRLAHPAARLSAAQREALIEGLVRTVRASQDAPATLSARSDG
jgi:hypothetical protein